MNAFDFGQAPHGGGTHAPERSFEEVRQLLQANALRVAQHLVPGGRVNGHEYVAAGTDGGRGRSFSLNLGTGVWKDFASGEGGADLINLFAHRHGVSQSDAKREAEEWLGMASRSGAGQFPAAQPARAALAPQAPSNDNDEDDPLWWRSVKPEARWDYQDAQGGVVGSVYRFRHPASGKKLIRPWDPVAGRWEFPKGKRPLLYLPELLASAGEIVFVEGEKCADAIRAAGRLGTSLMGGAQAIGAADLAPLAGRHVLLWRDNDPAGLDWQGKLTDALRAIGAASVRAVEIPAGKPAKWDSADAPEAERRAILDAAMAGRPVVQGRPPLRLVDHTFRAQFAGPPPERQWLVREVVPLGIPAILAAMGDTGKGMLLLDMAMKVAGGQPDPVLHPMAFGCSIARFGRAVMLSAEDDRAELHRRISRLRPSEAMQKRLADRLIVVALPNAGGSLPLIQASSKGVDVTDYYKRLRDELMAIDDLALIVVDPLVSFVQADLNKDSASAAFICSTFAELAQATGATVLSAHHMRKPNARGSIASVEQAREAIRGSSALVDNHRLAYALWPVSEDEARRVLKAHGEEAAGDSWRNRVVSGAVVKSNGPADRTVRTYVRDADSGLLIDRTMPMRVQAAEDIQPRRMDLVRAVAFAAEAGFPLTKTGRGGCWANQHRIPPSLRGWGKHRLETMLDDLLSEGLLVSCRDTGRAYDILDVPSGPFQRGEGVWSAGDAPGYPGEE